MGSRLVPILVLAVACAEDPAPPPEPEPAPAAPVVEAPTPDGPWVDVDAESLPAALRARPERALLVNVWSTWCDPCVEEMPQLVEAGRTYRGRGLGLVLISTDAPSQRDAARAFLEEQGAPAPSWFKTGSDDAFIRALHPEWSGALPATLLLDAERRPVRFWQAPVTAEELRGPIEALLGDPS